MKIFETLYDVLGIATIMESLRKESKEEELVLEEQEKSSNETYIQQPHKPVKFQYRPQTFDEYISQEKAKDKIKMKIEQIKNGFPRHFLIMGSAGHGKTTLAGIIAKELGFNFNVYVGSSFDIDAMKNFLIKNNETDKPNILFIDEVAELDKKTLTFMLPIIEDFKFEGNPQRKFIFIGATTDAEVIERRCSPFMDRMHCKCHLEEYSAEDIIKILKQYNDQIHKANIVEEVYDKLARNVRYVPRIALSFFDDLVTCEDIDKVLRMNRIIKDGLDDIDVKILKNLNSTRGKPIGEEALSIIANMTRQGYKTLKEPYLIRQGFISRGQRGRIILDKGKQFLQEITNV